MLNGAKKYHGAKVPGAQKFPSFSFLERKFPGPKVLRNESSQERMFPFAPGAKVPKSVGHKRLVEKLKWYGVDGEVNS